MVARYVLADADRTRTVASNCLAWPPGDYILMSDHLAYGTKMDTLSVPSGQRLDIEMMLDARAIEIAPITVSVRGIPLAEGAMGGIRISPEAVDKVRPVARVVVNVIPLAEHPWDHRPTPLRRIRMCGVFHGSGADDVRYRLRSHAGLPKRGARK